MKPQVRKFKLLTPINTSKTQQYKRHQQGMTPTNNKDNLEERFCVNIKIFQNFKEIAFHLVCTILYV